MLRFIVFIILAGFIISSCRSTRKIQSAISKKDTTNTVVGNTGDPHEDSMRLIDEVFDRHMQNKIDFHTFSAKINVDYQGSDGKKYDVNAFVRMKKDSLIWVSINAALGIEAMRILIDKDSVRMLNKLEKEYSVRPLDLLQDVAALPLDLTTMQDLILGNPIYFDSTSIVSYSRNSENFSLLSFGSLFRHLLTVSGSSYVIMNSKLDDLDPVRNRTGYLNYSDYEDKKGFYFSTNRMISVTEKTKLDIKLNYKQYEFNEMLSFPFSVPKNYTRK